MDRIKYISAPANQGNSAADEYASDIAFGSNRLVALWSPSSTGGIRQTLVGHNAHVTAVCYVSENVIFSGDEDGTVLRWENVSGAWSSSVVCAQGDGTVNAICSSGDAVFAGFSSGALRMWLVSSQEIFTEVLKYIPLTLEVHGAFLAVGGSDNGLHFFHVSDKLVFLARLKGHTDWITCARFLTSGENILLATGSQDRTVRVWKLTSVRPRKESHDAAVVQPGHGTQYTAQDPVDDDPDDSSDESDVDLTSAEFTLDSVLWKCQLEAVVIGHDSWITGLSLTQGPGYTQIATASSDRSLIIWRSHGADGSYEVWQRFGDFASSANMGFFGVHWLGKDTLATHDWGGAWHVWAVGDRSAALLAHNVRGHTNGKVASVRWHPTEAFLVSCGADKTTRIHAQTKGHFLELSRPQIHGYATVDAAFLDDTTLVGAAEEKTLRVFEATQISLEILRKLSGSTIDPLKSNTPIASVPPLGLSNRQGSESEVHGAEECLVDGEPPSEETLLGTTLYAETSKLFGHNFDLVSLDIARVRRLVASSNRATTPEQAGVRVFSVDLGEGSASAHSHVLSGHKLTVTRVAFSHDEKYLVTVSRDRSWCLWDVDSMSLVKAKSGAHARVIWDVAWDPHGAFFATGSRDKTIKCWSVPGGDEMFSIAMDAPVTALAAGPGMIYAGLETGAIVAVRVAQDGLDKKYILGVDVAHGQAVTMMDEREGLLASAGADGTVRVFQV